MQEWSVQTVKSWVLQYTYVLCANLTSILTHPLEKQQGQQRRRSNASSCASWAEEQTARCKGALATERSTVRSSLNDPICGISTHSIWTTIALQSTSNAIANVKMWQLGAQRHAFAIAFSHCDCTSVRRRVVLSCACSTWFRFVLFSLGFTMPCEETFQGQEIAEIISKTLLWPSPPHPDGSAAIGSKSF